MREQFTERRFQGASLVLIEHVNRIIEEYQEQGYRLSLRQVYYQLVSQLIIPNENAAYKNLGKLVSEGRLAGLLDWDAIEDRGRRGEYPQFWESPEAIISAAAETYRLDKWADQENHVVVMIEKSALEGVVSPVCSRLEVPFHANKGYSSSSALYTVGKQMQEKAVVHRKKLHVIYAGDHDPSGIQMSRDLADRLALFSQNPVNVMRIALNMPQIQRHNLPPNPVKDSDSRTPAYEAEFGTECWEVDALNPGLLATMFERAILSLRDSDVWAKSLDRENEHKEKIQSMLDGLE